MSVPEDMSYSEQHEWIRPLDRALAVEVGGHCRIGITAFAAESLGDAIFVDLPERGVVLRAGDPCGEIESTKAVSSLFAPVTGVVVAVNPDVLIDPSVISSDPYGEGWLLEIQVTEPPDRLLTPTQYGMLMSAP